MKPAETVASRGARAGPDRRAFLEALAAGAGVLGALGLGSLGACESTGPTGADRPPLRIPESVSAAGLTLVPSPGTAGIGGGESVPAWLYNGLMPGPTLRARRGSSAAITLVNQLPEPTIVHWHGLMVPEAADGHPRYAIAPGASYAYGFEVRQRAGTHWYHPHAHHRTGGQVHRGLAGFFIVSDEEEDALPLPRGSREVLLLLQDRRHQSDEGFTYSPSDGDLFSGLLGDVAFGNGVARPRLSVRATTYRFRVLNASQARVYRLGLSTGGPLVVIGNDGGLLPAPVEVESVYLGVGERIDFLADFSGLGKGERLVLISLPFQVDGGGSGPFPQGMALDLLELEGAGPDPDGAPRPLPAVLSTVPPLSPANAARARLFELSFGGTGHDSHLINGLSFDLDRVDEQIPLGQLERWIFRNTSELPHPVHLHGTHFQVVARSGGRGIVYPYEGGWKDTVLVMPLETVEVLVRFDQYPGVFPLHCHNLQHEDGGMMLNIEVI